MSRPTDQARPDLYSRVTNAIIAELEKGVRPWTKPWSAEHLAGRDDLATQEREEVAIIAAYLPKQLDDAAVTAAFIAGSCSSISQPLNCDTTPQSMSPLRSSP